MKRATVARNIALPAFRCLMVGAPGSGKGTISNRLAETFGLDHLSSGDVLRRHQVEQTDLGKAVEKHLQNGTLVPDQLMVKLMLAEVKRIERTRSGKLVLDGFPRTVKQAEQFDADEWLSCVINLNVPFDTIKQRLVGRYVHKASGRIYHLDFAPPKHGLLDDETGEPLERRRDDEPENVDERLSQYKALTEPMLNYYHNKRLLVEFSGTESNKIWPEVEAYVIEKFASGKKMAS